MKFTCTRDNLLRGLHLSSGIAMKPSNLPILSHIYIQAQESGVYIMSTNLEIAVKAHVRAKVEETGGFTVPAKTLVDYVSLLRDEQVDIRLDGNQLIIQSTHSSTKIKGESPDDYPVIPQIDRQFDIELAPRVLKEAFGKVLFAAAKNEIRPELSGVYCSFFARDGKDLVLAATDSYRLAEYSITLDQKKDERTCIIPAKTAAEFVRLLGFFPSETEKVTVALGEGQVSLLTDDVEIMSRLIDGTYPDYTQIIPTDFQTTIELHKESFINSIKSASLFSNTGVNAILFAANVQDKNCSVSSTSAQTGEHASQLDAVVLGENSSIMLNHRYLLDGVNQINDDTIECKMNGPDSPCIFKAKSSDEFIYIVMPIRQ